jgi:hypothetical protein
MLAKQAEGGWAAVFTLEIQTEEALAVLCPYEDVCGA